MVFSSIFLFSCAPKSAEVEVAEELEILEPTPTDTSILTTEEVEDESVETVE